MGGGYLHVKVRPNNKKIKLEISWRNKKGDLIQVEKKYLKHNRFCEKFSNPWSLEISLNCDLPKVENLTSYIISDNIVSLTWDKIEVAYGYEIQGPNSYGGTQTIKSIIYKGNIVGYKWPFVLPNNKHFFQVCAVNKNGSYSIFTTNIFVEINVPPIINSSSHPNSNKSYDSDELNISWEISKINEKFVVGYCYNFDQNPLTELDENNNIVETEQTKLIEDIANWEDGTYYFHLQSKSKINDGTFLSKTTHYKFNIESGVPIKGKPKTGIWFK